MLNRNAVRFYFVNLIFIKFLRSKVLSVDYGICITIYLIINSITKLFEHRDHKYKFIYCFRSLLIITQLLQTLTLTIETGSLLLNSNGLTYF